MSKTQFFHPEEVQLSNGIPVILQHYEGTAAATYWWNRTGSADERPAEAGFAHFLEHMLFKDASAKETGKASTGKTAGAIEGLGGDINAYTSFDQTVYHVTCAATHWEKVIDAFCKMAAPQNFLKTDFDREREVILEELRKNEDAPGRALFQKLFNLTYRKHPYGKPVIGYSKVLKAATVKTLESFYRRRYVSGQMGVILVGPLKDPKRKKALLSRMEKYFGKKVISPKKVETLKRSQEPPERVEPSFAELPFDVKTPTLALSFRIPDLDHEDVPALDILSGILGLGELGRLYQKLFYEKSLVTDVSGGMYIPHDAGMFYFQAEFEKSSQAADVIKALCAEFKRIKEEGPDREELARVLVNAESDKLYATQTADGMAGRIGFSRFVMGDLDFDQRYLAGLKEVDQDRVMAVARKYLTPSRLSWLVQIPKAEKGQLNLNALQAIFKQGLADSSQKGGSTAEKKAKAKISSKSGADRPEVRVLPSGLRVVALDRPHSPVFSVHASVLAGVRLETVTPVGTPALNWGASHLMSLTWTKGTGYRDAKEVARVVEGSAAGFDGYSGRNSVGLQMTGLARDWSRLSEVFTEVLVQPIFPENEIEHSRRVVEDSIRTIEDHSSQLCSRLFLETLFEKHPYGKLSYGSPESIGGINQDRLQRLHRAWVRPERLVISVSGKASGTDFENWLTDLDRALVELASGQEALTFPSQIQDEPSLKAHRWVEKSLGREQVHLIVGGLGLRLRDQDRYALHLAQNILGGQSGRLFLELREKKSLAYSVSPISFEGIERGYAATYIACSPEKRQEALAGIASVLENFAAEGPTPKEMRRAYEYFLGRRAMDLQSDSSLAAYLGLETLYGIPLLTEVQHGKQIREITQKQIRDLIESLLVKAKTVTSLVG